MTTTDYIFIVVDLALWAAIIWHRAQAKAVGELWWSCVGVAVIITLKIGVIADPFNQLSGGIYLDELLGHLIGVMVISLTLSWLLLIRYGSRRPYLRTRWISTAAVLGFLATTWFLGPIYDIPATADWIPSSVQNAPILVAHWSVLHLALLTFCVLFVSLAGAEGRTLPPGYVRLSIRLLLGAAILLALSSGAGVVANVALLFGGSKSPELRLAQNLLLMGVFALFFLAVTIPLARYRGGDGSSAASPDARVASLWAWIQGAGHAGSSVGQQDLELLPGVGNSLFDHVIDIRDRMWWLQGFIAPADLAAAARQARAQGYLFGTRARAYVTAMCLQLAAERVARMASPVSPPPANLGRLGGGRTISQEAHWLAAVSDALTARLAAGDQSALR